MWWECCGNIPSSASSTSSPMDVRKVVSSSIGLGSNSCVGALSKVRRILGVQLDRRLELLGLG